MSTWKKILEAVDALDEAGLTSTDPGVLNQKVKLTIGKSQVEFTVPEMLELIKNGQLQSMVQSGQVRKLPGMGTKDQEGQARVQAAISDTFGAHARDKTPKGQFDFSDEE